MSGVVPTLDELDAAYAAQRVHKHSMLWAQFAASYLPTSGIPEKAALRAAEAADAMLEEWIKRWDTPAGVDQ
jgi:hypothetical protein